MKEEARKRIERECTHFTGVGDEFRRRWAFVGRFCPCGSLGSKLHQVTDAAEDFLESIVGPSLMLSPAPEDRRELCARSVALDAWMLAAVEVLPPGEPALSLVLYVVALFCGGDRAEK